MKRITLLLFIILFVSGCMSDRINVSTKLTGHGKSGDAVDVLEDDGATVVDVHSKSGIGRLELTPVTDKWPATITVRLHLHGLESLRITTGEFTISTSLTSSSPHKQLCEVIYNNEKRRTIVTEDSSYWIPLTVVNKKESGSFGIPLANGYFEVILPEILFDNNFEIIFIQWIDFYR